MGAIAIITSVFATFVFCIETTNVILVTEKCYQYKVTHDNHLKKAF